MLNQEIKTVDNFTNLQSRIPMTRAIEQEALDIWNIEGWGKAQVYLEKLNFTPSEIESAKEKWNEGKSLYPFGA